MQKMLYLIFFIIFTMSIAAAPYSTPFVDITQTGMEFSNFAGWYSDPVSGWMPYGDGSIYTAWGNLWLEYTAFLTPGNWNIGINVQNAGQLDSRYPNFNIYNTLNNSYLYIPASQNEVNHGYVNINLTQSTNVTVRYTWTNDWCISPYDANIIVVSAFFDNTATTAPILNATEAPEPGAIFLLAIGSFALACLGRNQAKARKI
ncbi:MAG: hypothetical protein HUU50_20815 [Candidatus Brocadiae bacterium]|nr:hypothetical protein [Candidatus Brocadiia bacterium]